MKRCQRAKRLLRENRFFDVTLNPPPTTHAKIMKDSKNIEIEYLRAVAIGLTLLSHLPELLPFHKDLFLKIFAVYMPWTGVDLFFCISGYVVSKAFLEKLDHQREKGSYWVAVQAFWIRRAYRLIPTAWLWVLIPIILSIFYNTSGVFGETYHNIRSLTAVMTFSGNIANQYGLTLGPNSVYWSLALEEQFYFIFPLFLFFVKTSKSRVILLALALVIQFPINRDPFGSPESAMASSFRLDAMIWGILIYYFSKSAHYHNFEPTFAFSSLIKKIITCLILIYLLGAISGQMIATPISIGLIAMTSATLVFLASFDKGYIPRIGGISPIIEWMGSRSYGIYVIHFPAYRLSTEFWHRYATANNLEYTGQFTAELLLTAGILIVLMSEINYRVIEQPLRKRGATIANKKLLAQHTLSSESIS